jgi:haloalkane dehalogenase
MSNARPAWIPPERYPFASHAVDIQGCRVHYIDEGAGPPLLLLHGNPTWSFLYRDIVRGLRDRFRCIALDYPGFGLSTAAPGYGFRPQDHAAVVEEFVSTLDLRDALVMVQDWGGPIGLCVAGKHPERFRGLIIGNTWAWPANGDPHFERFSRLMGGAVGGFFIRHFNAFVNLMIPAGTKRVKLPREIMRAYRGPFPTKTSREPTHIFPREIIASRDFLAATAENLGRLSHLPALIVWGNRDVAFRDRERQRFESTFPRHQTVVLEGAGHLIQEDAPDEIVRAVRSWSDAELK